MNSQVTSRGSSSIMYNSKSKRDYDGKNTETVYASKDCRPAVADIGADKGSRLSQAFVQEMNKRIN